MYEGGILMIQQFFKKLFDEFLQEQKEEIIAKLCFWIAYYYISVPKYMVNSSGILVHMNQTHEGYTYDTIEDFYGSIVGKQEHRSILKVEYTILNLRK